MKKFDINKLSKGKSRNIKIGELSKDVIELLDLDLKPQNINIWSTRIEEHCEKYIAKYAMPREIEYKKELPKTLVGKISYTTLLENEKKNDK